MATTASALADALTTTLITNGSGFFSSSNVSMNDWGILDTSTCNTCFMILPGGFDDTPVGYGNPASEQHRYTLHLLALTRDAGISTNTLNAIWKAEVDVRNTLALDDTLGGSALFAQLIRSGGWDGKTWIGTETGAIAFAEQYFDIEVTAID